MTKFRKKQENRRHVFLKFLFRLILRGGGTIYSNGFFVKTIFADRYINRRELRLVSLENSFSIEYRIKKMFFVFVSYRELSMFKVLRKIE